MLNLTRRLFLKSAGAAATIPALGIIEAAQENEVVVDRAPIFGNMELVGAGPISQEAIDLAEAPNARILINNRLLHNLDFAQINYHADFINAAANILPWERKPVITEFSLDLRAPVDPEMSEYFHNQDRINVRIIPPYSRWVYLADYLISRLEYSHA